MKVPALLQAPKSIGLAQGRQATIISSVEKYQGLHPGESEDCKKQTLLLKDAQNLTCSEIKHRGSNLKGAWGQIHLLILEGLAEGKWDSH